MSPKMTRIALAHKAAVRGDEGDPAAKRVSSANRSIIEMHDVKSRANKHPTRALFLSLTDPENVNA